MTLGGLAIAIGALVDDAIIDVENVFRRLRENAHLPEGERRPALEVVYRAPASRSAARSSSRPSSSSWCSCRSSSSRASRAGCSQPLGLAYIVSLLASLVVALTLTPALCALPAAARARRSLAERRAARRALAEGALRAACSRRRCAHPQAGRSSARRWRSSSPRWPSCPFLGRAFLPEFNEGALTISAVTLPGTSLEESDELGRRGRAGAARASRRSTATARRTGRAELDEHAQGVDAAELDVVARRSRGSGPRTSSWRRCARTSRSVPGHDITIGQPISPPHRPHALGHAGEHRGEDLRRRPLQAARAGRAGPQARGRGARASWTSRSSSRSDIPMLEIRFDRDAIARLRPDRRARSPRRSRRPFAGRDGRAGARRAATPSTSWCALGDADAGGPRTRSRATPVDTPGGAQASRCRRWPSIDARARARTRSAARTCSGRSWCMATSRAATCAASSTTSGAASPAQVPLAATGYYVDYGGQFESAEEATRHHRRCSASLVVVGIVPAARTSPSARCATRCSSWSTCRWR